MNRRLFSPAQLEAYEKRWKRVQWMSAALLIVDVPCLIALRHSGLALFSCVMVAAVTVCGCVYASRQLRKAGLQAPAGYADPGVDDYSLPGLIDPLTLFDSDD